MDVDVDVDFQLQIVRDLTSYTLYLFPYFIDYTACNVD